MKDMRAATETVETRTRAGIGVLETPPALQAELGGAALHELDQPLGVSSDVMAPSSWLPPCSGWIEEEPLRGSTRGAFFRERVVEGERAGSSVGGQMSRQEK